jgi:hypothetical protein
LTTGFLPIFYTGAFFLAACAGYLFCTQLLTRWRGIAGSAFVAIPAFGACSYIGFILIILTVGISPAKGLLQGSFQPISYIVAYGLPGGIGSWLSVKAFRLVFPTSQQQ